MMTTIRELLERYLNRELRRMTISGARHSDGPSRVKIRPVLLSGKLMYQASVSVGAKEFHRNYTEKAALDYIEELMGGQFRQIQIEGADADATALVSKKGKVTIREKRHPVRMQNRSLAHDREKSYILQEGIPVPFLVDLGVMTAGGRVVAARYDKFRQINRFLEFIEDVLPCLDRERELTILDFGCGKSYLTFAMYYYLCCLKQYRVQIIGLDLKEDVIEHCSALAEKYGYQGLHFSMGDIASYEGVSRVDMVVTLHACDTATDHALARAVRWGASVILSVPCCQHELNGQIRNEVLEPVLSYGILKERMAALITDGIRGELLKEQGYQVQILEFIDMEHTPKNLLIRAVKKGSGGGDPEKLAECMRRLHVKPLLAELLRRQEAPGEENCD